MHDALSNVSRLHIGPRRFKQGQGCMCVVVVVIPGGLISLATHGRAHVKFEQAQFPRRRGRRVGPVGVLHVTVVTTTDGG